MAELTHVDLERHHYRAIRDNSSYKVLGMMEVRLEEMAMNTPLMPNNDDLSDRVANLESISAQPGGVPRAFEDKLQQLQGQVIYLQKKCLDLEKIIVAKGRQPKFR